MINIIKNTNPLRKKRGQEGGRVVPDWVIDKMLTKYEEPSTSEGIDEIIYV